MKLSHTRLKNTFCLLKSENHRPQNTKFTLIFLTNVQFKVCLVRQAPHGDTVQQKETNVFSGKTEYIPLCLILQFTHLN